MATNNATNTSNPIAVSQGGTGDSSLVAYTPLCGGTTGTGAIQSVASLGSSGQPLTSNGAAALPSFQTLSGGGALTVPPITNNWYPSSMLFNGLATSTAGISTITGTLWFVPFFVTCASTYKAIGVLIGAVAAGTTVLGLYNDSGSAAPTGSPIANSNSTSITNNANTFGSYTFSSPITLSTGVYWCAFSVSSTSIIYGVPNGSVAGRGLGLDAAPTTANFFNPVAGYSQTFSYSATLPSVGSITRFLTNAQPGDSYVFLQGN